ncbi:MAG TPA: glycosyltransferase [Planctomycetota bacterium]|nr:glycosyltransferase [Planctomycetota bacterium]
MRVLHLLTTLDRGGAEYQVAALCRALRRRGRVEPAVAYLKGDGELAPALLAAGIPVARLGQVAPFRALRLLRAHRPEVLHTHLFKADLLGALLAARAGVPALVSTKHNEDPYLVDGIWRSIGRRAALRAGGVIAISEGVARFLGRTLGLPDGRVRVIRYGLDPAIAPRGGGAAFREALGVPASAPLAVCLARLSPQKGLDVLVEAARRLRGAVPDARVAIVGRGPDGAALRDRVRARGLQGRVLFAGFLPDPGPAYDAADCVVLPSRWEGFGLAALEARAAGKRVVVSAAGGLPEAAGADGVVVPVGDATALADAIAAELSRDAVAASRGGVRAAAIRARALGEFPLDGAAEAHEALYEQLRAARPGPAAPAATTTPPAPAAPAAPVEPLEPAEPPAPAARAAPRTRTVLIVARAGTGGAGRHVRMLVERLDRRRWTPVVAASPVEDPAFPDALVALGARVVPVPMERDPAPFRDLASFHAVRDLVRSGKFDLVHAHASKPGAFARLAAKRAGTPVLYTPHGWAFAYAEGAARRELFLRAERALGRRGGLVHCVSEAEADLAAGEGIVPADRLRVVPNSVPAPPPPDPAALEALRRRLGVPPWEPVVLMAARLAPPKDPLAFLAAASAAPSGMFLLAGDGPLLDDCRAAAGPRSRVLGERDDVANLLAISEVAVLATRYDACPYFALEAAAAGRPIVAPADAVPAALAPGLVPFDPADPESLPRVLAPLLSGDGAPRRAALGAAARAAWAAHFAPEPWIDRMQALYDEAAG